MKKPDLTTLHRGRSETTWWWWRDVQNRLIKWTLALLLGRRYQVILKVEGTGYHDGSNKVIQANPQLFAKKSAEEQFTFTQAILAHEVGHGLFTGNWERKGRQALAEMVNFLEDERIERAMAIAYPGIAELFPLIGKEFLSQQTPITGPANMAAYSACLVWRWSKRFEDEPAMFKRLGMSEEAQEIWGEVRELVETAWTAKKVITVVSLAMQILEILKIPETAPARNLVGVWEDRGPAIGEDGKLIPVMDFPKGALEGDPGKPALKKEDLPDATGLGDNFSGPEPYVELENMARPIATRLAEALKVPTPEARAQAHEWRGRYCFRQEIRTPDKPHLAPQAVGLSARSLALEVLVDRSGSMCDLEVQVRLAVMAIYLACLDLNIPLSITYFGNDMYTDPESIKTLTCPVCKQGSNPETVKTMIAGFHGATGCEYLYWGLLDAESNLKFRPEAVRKVIVIHDGQPVWVCGTKSDLEMSMMKVKDMESSGIGCFGIYLGRSDGDFNKLKTIFPHLAKTEAKMLPQALGNLLKSLL